MFNFCIESECQSTVRGQGSKLNWRKASDLTERQKTDEKSHYEKLEVFRYSIKEKPSVIREKKHVTYSIGKKHQSRRMYHRLIQEMDAK